MNSAQRMSSLALRGVCAVALANAPFWILGQVFFMNRGFVNVDTVVAVGVMAVSPWLGLALLVLAWIIDLVVSQSLTFHFGSPAEFVASVRFASSLRLRDYAQWSHLALALPFLVSAMGLRAVAWRQVRLLPMLFPLVVMLVVIDAANGSSLLSNRDQWRLPFNLAGSPSANLLRQQKGGGHDLHLGTITKSETAQGLTDIPRWAAANPGRSVLLVIVESLGLPNDATLDKWLDDQLVDKTIQAHFQVQRTSLPFRGSTTASELRSMCALAGSYRGLDAETGSTCLPAKMARLGWEPIGFHGFSARMFDRHTWWPLMGFKQVHFIDSPLLRDKPLCGSTFRGGCDAALIDSAVEALSAGNRFVYLLTLNTHLPVTPVPSPRDLSTLCSAASAPREVCEFVAIQGDLLRHLSKKIASVKPSPLVIVIGDHAPPFSRRASRSAFSGRNVPAYVLMPYETGSLN